MRGLVAPASTWSRFKGAMQRPHNTRSPPPEESFHVARRSAPSERSAPHLCTRYPRPPHDPEYPWIVAGVTAAWPLVAYRASVHPSGTPWCSFQTRTHAVYISAMPKSLPPPLEPFLFPGEPPASGAPGGIPAPAGRPAPERSSANSSPLLGRLRSVPGQSHLNSWRVSHRQPAGLTEARILACPRIHCHGT